MIGFKTRPQRAQEQAFRWLVKLESTRATEAEEQEFFQWLESSALNQAAYIKAEELWQRGDALAHVVRSTKEQPRIFNAWPNWAAACACLFVGILFFVFNTVTPSENTRFATSVGEQKKHSLVDGSNITLNTASALHVNINAQQRRVQLKSGEAFFDVKPDKNRPFEVVTEHGVVRVLGTRFSVRKTTTDTVVTVIEGRVALGALTQDKRFSLAKELVKNQQLALAAARDGREPESVNAANILAWRKQQLIFKQQPLALVVAELNRYYPETLSILSPELENQKITAVLQLNNFDSTVNTLAAPFGLVVVKAGETYYLQEQPALP